MIVLQLTVHVFYLQPAAETMATTCEIDGWKKIVTRQILNHDANGEYMFQPVLIAHHTMPEPSWPRVPQLWFLDYGSMDTKTVKSQQRTCSTVC